jgi:hypothetical protein
MNRSSFGSPRDFCAYLGQSGIDDRRAKPSSLPPYPTDVNATKTIWRR